MLSRPWQLSMSYWVIMGTCCTTGPPEAALHQAYNSLSASADVACLGKRDEPSLRSTPVQGPRWLRLESSALCLPAFKHMRLFGGKGSSRQSSFRFRHAMCRVFVRYSSRYIAGGHGG